MRFILWYLVYWGIYIVSNYLHYGNRWVEKEIETHGMSGVSIAWTISTVIFFVLYFFIIREDAP